MLNLQNVNSQMRAERSVFGKHDLLSIGHKVDLELTLPFLLGPGLEVIKLEFNLRLKIKRNDWLLADECPQAANHCTLF